MNKKLDLLDKVFIVWLSGFAILGLLFITSFAVGDKESTIGYARALMPFIAFTIATRITMWIVTLFRRLLERGKENSDG
jgi:hypothetical protein